MQRTNPEATYAEGQIVPMMLAGLLDEGDAGHILDTAVESLTTLIASAVAEDEALTEKIEWAARAVDVALWGLDRRLAVESLRDLRRRRTSVRRRLGKLRRALADTRREVEEFEVEVGVEAREAAK